MQGVLEDFATLCIRFCKKYKVPFCWLLLLLAVPLDDRVTFGFNKVTISLVRRCLACKTVLPEHVSLL